MNVLKELLGRKRNRGIPSKANITKYTIGTRVPHNEKAELIVRSVLAHKPSGLVKLK